MFMILEKDFQCRMFNIKRWGRAVQWAKSWLRKALELALENVDFIFWKLGANNVISLI